MDRWSDESVERVLVGRRAVRRIRFNREVEINEGGTGWTSARLLEISLAGFKLEGYPRNSRRRSMWLRFGDMAPLPAKVIWVSPDEIGCAFLFPIERAALEAIIGAPQP